MKIIVKDKEPLTFKDIGPGEYFKFRLDTHLCIKSLNPLISNEYFTLKDTEVISGRNANPDAWVYRVAIDTIEIRELH